MNWESWKAWAPLSLRLAMGIGLIRHGGIKLFAEGGHANVSHLISQLGVPLPDLMAWITGGVEFGGGVGMLLGLFTRIAAGANALNFLALIVLATTAGGTPPPLPGGDPLPEMREALLSFAVTLSIVLSGPGRLALDSLRSGSRRSTDS
jgi:putative oxidoreductase